MPTSVEHRLRMYAHNVSVAAGLRDAAAEECTSELHDHLLAAYENALGRGLNEAEAVRHALTQFGETRVVGAGLAAQQRRRHWLTSLRLPRGLLVLAAADIAVAAFRTWRTVPGRAASMSVGRVLTIGAVSAAIYVVLLVVFRFAIAQRRAGRRGPGHYDRAAATALAISAIAGWLELRPGATPIALHAWVDAITPIGIPWTWMFVLASSTTLLGIVANNVWSATRSGGL